MNKNNEISRKPLNLRERIEIEHKYRYGETISNIAKLLNRHRSTIYREINGKPRTGVGKYQADISHRKALKRIAKRGNISILECHEQLYKYMVDKFKLGWSPEQISLRLPIEFKKDESMRISYETIYTYVYSCIGSNGKAKKGYEDLREYLPRRHKRRSKKGFRKARKLAQKENKPSIEDRPKEVDDRKNIGHWEDDFVVSRGSKVCIKSVNERKSGVVFFSKTVDGTAVSGDTVLIDRLSNIPSKYLKTLTRDNGSENVNFEFIQNELGVMVYYAHAYCSYERGSNENCNGLLRRFLHLLKCFTKRLVSHYFLECSILKMDNYMELCYNCMFVI